jgi:heme-degrading monooxygenase HmoA
MTQPGYISGETLFDIEHPGECLVISRWETVEYWNKWAYSQERAKIDGKIGTLTGGKIEYHAYSPMVPQTIAEKTTHRQAERMTNS